jgi:uncharacterized membrane protein
MEDRLDAIDWNIAWEGILENSLPMSWNLFLALLPLAMSCELFHRPRSPIIRWGIWLLVLITLLPNLQRSVPFAALLVIRFGLFPLMVLISLALTAVVVGAIAWDKKQMNSGCWWLGCAIFILFLPNAAYILTDVIHFVIDVRKGYPMGTTIAILLPQYLLFLSVGYEAYVASLMNIGYFLTQQGTKKFVSGTELGIHVLSAIAVYLGRFSRFNSWDVFVNPGKLLQEVGQTLTSPNALLAIGVLFCIFAGSYWLCKRITIGLMGQKVLKSSEF